MRRIAVLLTVLFCLGCAGVRPPDDPAEDRGFRNLQVLSPAMTREELLVTMRRFTQALGVGCDYCHVANAPGTEPEMDFPADAKPEKDVARVMIRMVNGINRDFIERVPNSTSRVSCWTCHRGEAQPAPVPALPERKREG